MCLFCVYAKGAVRQQRKRLRLGLPPGANHLEQLTKGIAHGEWGLKGEGERSLGVNHVAGARSFDAVLGVGVDLIDPQDLRGTPRRMMLGLPRS